MTMQEKLEEKTIEKGWGTGFQDSRTKKVAKYEFGVYKETELLEMFRTDCKDVMDALEKEAKKRRDFLKQEDPLSNYEVRSVYTRVRLPIVQKIDKHN